MKEKDQENMIIINNLTEENLKYKNLDEKNKRLEKELFEKNHEIEELSKIVHKLDDSSFCNVQLTMQKFLTLENKYSLLKDEYGILKNNYEKVLLKIDSQNNIIKELKKVLLKKCLFNEFYN